MGAGHLLHMMAGMFKQLAWTLCWIQFEGSGFLQSLSLLGSHVLSQQQALQPDCIHAVYEHVHLVSRVSLQAMNLAV
jgi:hypothetical protein